MNLCRNQHKAVAFTWGACPVCAMRDERDRALARLESFTVGAAAITLGEPLSDGTACDMGAPPVPADQGVPFPPPPGDGELPDAHVFDQTWGAT